MNYAISLSQTTAKKVLVITLLFSIFGISCNKDETPVPEPAPGIPPKSTMIMDFADFTETDTTSGKSTATYNHWGWATTNILVWNIAISINLAIPVASFHEAINHEGVYNPETSTWIWSYNFYAGGIVHLAELHASLVSEGVKWEMYISKNNHYTNFLWYSGISNLTNTHGHWEMNKNPQESTQYLYIEWNRDIDNGTADIKYTNIIPDNEDNGSYIYYGVNNELPYNAFYDIYSVSQANLNNIKWHRETKDGRIRDEMHFGDFDWRCWDNSLQDTACE
jgi:hypothetical protein